VRPLQQRLRKTGIRGTDPRTGRHISPAPSVKPVGLMPGPVRKTGRAGSAAADQRLGMTGPLGHRPIKPENSGVAPKGKISRRDRFLTSPETRGMHRKKGAFSIEIQIRGFKFCLNNLISFVSDSNQNPLCKYCMLSTSRLLIICFLSTLNTPLFYWCSLR